MEWTHTIFKRSGKVKENLSRGSKVETQKMITQNKVDLMQSLNCLLLSYCNMSLSEKHCFLRLLPQGSMEFYNMVLIYYKKYFFSNFWNTNT